MFSEWHFVEVNNFISDTLLAAFLFFWGKKLHQLKTDKLFFESWMKFFFLLAASAFLGGLGHLLSYYMGMWGKWASWQLSMITVMILEIGLLTVLNTSKVFNFLAYLKIVVFSALLLLDMNYNWVKTDMTLGIIFIIIPILYMFYKRTKNLGFIIIIGGLLANGLAGAVHSLNINLATYFDKSDLAHVISIICFGTVFFGIKYLYKSRPLSIS